MTGTVVDNVTPGVAPYTYALLGSPTAGTHGTLTFNAGRHLQLHADDDG